MIKPDGSIGALNDASIGVTGALENVSTSYSLSEMNINVQRYAVVR